MAGTLNRAYEEKTLTDKQQENALNNARSRAVQKAWNREVDYIKEGKGTRDWTPEQQEEILRNGKLTGYEGHHMRSVSNGETFEEKMEIGSNENDIQFLENTSDNNEHLRAHGRNTRNRTNGYYDVNEEKMYDFGDKEPQPPKAEKLSNPVVKQEKDQIQDTNKKNENKSNVDQYGVDLNKAEQKSESAQNKTISR